MPINGCDHECSYPGVFDDRPATARSRSCGGRSRPHHPRCRLPATLSLVSVGLGVSFVPEMMRVIGVDGVVFRPLEACHNVGAPPHLATRREHPSPAASRFQPVVRVILASGANNTNYSVDDGIFVDH